MNYYYYEKYNFCDPLTMHRGAVGGGHIFKCIFSDLMFHQPHKTMFKSFSEYMGGKEKSSWKALVYPPTGLAT